MSESPITSRGNWEYTELNSITQRRGKGTKEWSPVDQPPPEPQLILSLVIESQAFGEPDHWSLFVAPEGGTGTTYQVRGDAELMHHSHVDGVNIQALESFKTAYTLADLTQDQVGWVAYHANHEAPPSTPNRASVKENCQGWAARVLERLAERGIVTEDWLASVKGMVNPF